MAKTYRTTPNEFYRKFSATRQTINQNDVVGTFNSFPKAAQKLKEAQVREKGLKQRYLQEPRGKAIRIASQSASEKGLQGKGKAMYVSKNWKKFL